MHDGAWLLSLCEQVRLRQTSSVVSTSRTVEQSNSRTVEQSNSRTVEQSNGRTIEQSNSRTVEQSNSRTVGQKWRSGLFYPFIEGA